MIIKTLQKLRIGWWLGCSCLALGGMTEAAEVSLENAAAAAKHWLEANAAPLGEPLSAVAKKVDAYRDSNGQAMYYVVSLDPAGFVIVSGDDSVEPVIAFARRGQFDPSPANPLGALVGPDVRERMAQVRQAGLTTSLSAPQIRARSKWAELGKAGKQRLPRANGVEQVLDLRVAPLVQSLWDQGSAGEFACYNYYTPPYEAGNLNNYPCGCVATAMAQLMRFHQHPTAGVGTGPLQVLVNSAPINRNLLGGDEAGGPYVWTNMPLVLNAPTLEHCKAIGALTADAGTAVRMNYGASGSAAETLGAKAALVGTFQYSQAVFGQLNNPADLIAAINPSLDAHYPVLLGIGGLPGEHELVCDGYGYCSSTLYHHLNLGWSGLANVWYALPEVDTGFYRFTYLSDCVYNIYTTGTGEIISGRVLDSFGRPVAGARVTAEAVNGGTYVAESDTNGIYALAKLPSASRFEIKVLASGYDPAITNATTGTSRDFSLTGNLWGQDFTLVPSSGPPIIIMAEPTSHDANWAEPVAFQAIAAGQPPLSYQWRLNGADLVDGPNVNGAENSRLTLNAVSDADAGDYCVVVTNSFGSVTSMVAVLTLEHLSLGQPPPDQSVQAQQTISFNANAAGVPPLAFHWYKNGAEVFNDNKISGATSQTLTLQGVSALAAGSYSFVVTNAFGCLTSAVASLPVADPFISRPPLSQVIDVGGRATFSVAAGGTPPVSYQWRKDGRNLDGATSTSLSLAQVHQYDMGGYDLVVSNAFGCVTSSVATLTGNLAPADSFNSYADSYVSTFAEQADGKILVGGYFAYLNGQSLNCLGRLNADGSVDTTFTSPLDPGGSVSSLAIQQDGKILVGGHFGVQSGRKSNFVRLNANGTLDGTFIPTADFTVDCVVAQSDGRLLVSGGFLSLGGQPRRWLGRFNANGTLDTSFTPAADGEVSSILPQPDGKILVGGWFNNLNGQPRAHIGRVKQDGTLDTTFNPEGTDTYVWCLALQPDGKILVGGRFSTLGNRACNFLGRLNSDGTLDADFNAQIGGDPGNGFVKSIVLQADGKILIGGHFSFVDGEMRGNLARLNRDGSLDTTFSSQADWVVDGLAVQRDGKVLVGGMFSVLAGKPRAHLGRLYASEPAKERFVFDGRAITWQRDGTSPEALYTAFEGSIDGGATWVSLGMGVPAQGGWQLAKNWADEFLLRARACVAQGQNCGSSWFIESVQSITNVSVQLPTTIIWATPADLTYGEALGLEQLNAQASFDGTNIPGAFSYSPPAGTMLNAGTGQVLSVTFAPDASTLYLPATSSVSITVKKAPLTVAALDAERVYGNPNPAFSATISGFVNGDTEAAVSGMPSLSTSATTNSPVGLYTINTTPGSLSSSNYCFLQVFSGWLTVEPALLTVSANNTTRLFSASNPPLSGEISGLQNGDEISVAFRTSATVQSPVGIYPIFPELVDPDRKLINYSIVTNIGTLTVTASSPTLGIPKFVEDGLGFEVRTAPGAQYILEYTDSLEGAAWCPIASAPGTGGEVTLTDTNFTRSARFYRLRVR